MNICIKYIVLAGLLGLLSACVVSGYSPDISNGYKFIQGYQKKTTIGHTDPVQRKKDVLSCGVIKYFNGELDLNTRYPGMTSEQVTKRHKRIHNCMEAKGYIFKSSINCTKKGKPTGFCN